MAAVRLCFLSLHRVDFITFILLRILFTTKLLSLVYTISWDVLGILLFSNSIRISFISLTLTSRTSGQQPHPFNLISIYLSLQFYTLDHAHAIEDSLYPADLFFFLMPYGLAYL